MYLSGFSVLCHIIAVIITFTSGCILGAMASHMKEMQFFNSLLYMMLSFVRFAFELIYIFVQVSESIKCSQKITLRRLRGVKKPLSNIEKNEYNFCYVKILMFVIPITLIEAFLLKIMHFIQ